MRETVSLTLVRRLIQDFNGGYSSYRPHPTPSSSQVKTNNDKTNCDDFVKTRDYINYAIRKKKRCHNLMETFIKARNIIMLAETRFVT